MKGVPSGGDWGLQRSGAIILDGTVGTTISNVTMERNDGNAILISGHNMETKVTGCDIRFTGDTAIAAWGRTDEFGNNGTNGIYVRTTTPPVFLVCSGSSGGVLFRNEGRTTINNTLWSVASAASCVLMRAIPM